MSRYPGAQWRPLAINYSDNGISPRFLVVHGTQGTLASADSWFRDSRARASAHFGISKLGTVYQWVDTSDRAWHAVDANSVGIGCEMEMWQGEALTSQQLAQLGRLFAWVHSQHSAVPLRRASSSSGSGLIGHSEGGQAWGGHSDPGDRVLAQFSEIIKVAGGTQPPTPTTQAPPFPYPAGHYLGQPDPSMYCHSGCFGGIDHTNVHTWQARMAQRGWAISTDGCFGPQSESITRQFQQEKGLAVDGKVGPHTWSATWNLPVS